MTQPHFPHLMRPEQAELLDRLDEGIEKIAQAVIRFNSLLNDADNPTPPISIRHKGRDMSTFSGEISVSLDLQKLRLLDKMDRLNIQHPAPQKRRAA